MQTLLWNTLVSVTAQTVWCKSTKAVKGAELVLPRLWEPGGDGYPGYDWYVGIKVLLEETEVSAYDTAVENQNTLITLYKAAETSVSVNTMHPFYTSRLDEDELAETRM